MSRPEEEKKVDRTLDMSTRASMEMEVKPEK